MTILHIAHSADWQRAIRTGEYAVSTRGLSLADVGYIHASDTDQLVGVATRFYADDPDALVVLELDESVIVADGTRVVREDAGHGELFPHIYGVIRPGYVVSIRSAGFIDGSFVIN